MTDYNNSFNIPIGSAESSSYNPSPEIQIEPHHISLSDDSTKEVEHTIAREIVDDLKVQGLVDVISQAYERLATLCENRMVLVTSLLIMDKHGTPIDSLSHYYVVGKPVEVLASAENLHAMICDDIEEGLKDNAKNDKSGSPESGSTEKTA